MTVAFEQIPLPRIVTKDGSWSYQMTSDDMMMLARALNGEEGPTGAPRLAWCYAQRMYQGRNAYSSFASMVMNHSQVINPRWASTGEHCRPGGDYVGEPECNGAASRPYNLRRPWSAMRAGLPEQLLAWATGQVRNPIPRGTDFAGVSLVLRKIAGRNPEGFRAVYQGPPGNTVVSTTASRAWPSDDFVQLRTTNLYGREVLVGLDEDYRVNAIAVPLAVAGVIAGMWAAWKSRR